MIFLHLGMQLRLAHRSDLSAINDIYNQAVKELFCTAHLTPVSMEQRVTWYREHDPGRFPVYVITEEGRVLGWVSLAPYRAGRQALKHVAEVSYYVDQDHRRRGIGQQLLNHAMAVAPGFEFSILIAILLGKNAASIGLLERSGFTRWGKMPGIARIGNERADHLYYGRKL
jgi:phosphinothricin acetyltransferase